MRNKLLMYVYMYARVPGPFVFDRLKELALKISSKDCFCPHNKTQCS